MNLPSHYPTDPSTYETARLRLQNSFRDGDAFPCNAGSAQARKPELNRGALECSLLRCDDVLHLLEKEKPRSQG
jgi:hypothetical protein